MGNLKSSPSVFNYSSKTMNSEIDDNNGLLLQDVYFPEEMIAHILFFVDPESLVFNGRRVCKLWKRLIETSVLKLKVDTGPFKSLETIEYDKRLRLHLKWYEYFVICKNDPFNKNLLLNPCGREKFNHWTIIENGGHNWAIEDTPEGSDPFPECLKEEESTVSCFVTSFQRGLKEQVIPLVKHGFLSKIMDEVQPVISIREFYSARFDCESVFCIRVELLDGKKSIVSKYEQPFDIPERMLWHEVKHEFKNYGPGVRFIKYVHGGCDRQFWAGHYGAKMTGACVKLLYPVESKEQEMDEEIEDSAID